MKNLEVEYEFVFLLDCLPQDERDQYKISEELMAFLASKNIKSYVNKGNTKSDIIEIMNSLKNNAENGHKFLLHIISHGWENGLWLKSSQETIEWKELTSNLYELNEKLDNTLIVNMTSCKGLNGIRMVDESQNDYPFFCLIGCSRDLYIDEGKAANEKFYSKILEGKDISDVTKEIQSELIKDLYVISAEGYRKIKTTIKSKI